MEVRKLNEFTRGWFIGHFDPSIYKTSEFEVGILTHKKGEEWPAHYHTAVEINCLISGKILIRDRVLEAGDVFKFDSGEVANPVFLEDCVVVVVKTPSLPNDKFIYEGTIL